MAESPRAARFRFLYRETEGSLNAFEEILKIMPEKKYDRCY